MDSSKYRGQNCTSQSDAISPWYCNSYAENFIWIWTVLLLGATVPVQHCAVSVWPSGRHPTETDQGCGGDIGRKFSKEYPQLNPHAHGVRAACSGTFINIIFLDLGLRLCLSNSHTIFLLKPHFRSSNITIDFYIVFPSYSSSKLSNKCLTIPPLPSLPTLYPIPLTQSVLNTQFP